MSSDTENWKENIGPLFIEYSKEKYRSDSNAQKGLPQPELETPSKATDILLNLPDTSGHNVESVNFLEIVTQRRSLRVYSDDPLSLEELSYLLWCTQGVKNIYRRETNEIARKFRSNITMRTVPSAGMRHAFETYLLVNRVREVQPGLYRYIALEHKLLQVSLDEGLPDKVSEGCNSQQFVKNGAVVFLWVAFPARMAHVYGNRGYRYLFLDAGHVCQNLYLASEVIGCGTCAVGSYNDTQLNELLGIDGESQFVIYVAPVGKKR